LATIFNGIVGCALTLSADLVLRSIAKSFLPEFIVTSSHATEHGRTLI
jgi:hypothetical protein